MFISKKELKEIKDNISGLRKDVVYLNEKKSDIMFNAVDRLNGGVVSYGDKDLVIALLLEHLGLCVSYDRVQNKTSIVDIKKYLKKEKKNGRS